MMVKSIKKHILVRALVTIWLFISPIAFASDSTEKSHITFSFWDQASPPFAFLKDGELAGGIIKDLGDAISLRLNLPIKYIKLPVARIEPYLRTGKIDADCITNAIWKETPDEYHWSPVLFEGADRILIRKGEQEINEFSDMRNLRLGIYNGYVYHPTIMEMIEHKELKTVKVADIEKGIMLLQLGRIDALIDFGVLIHYQLLEQKLHNELTLAKKHADNFELSCAYSKKSSISKELLDEAINHLNETGQVNEILNKYR